MRVQVTNVLARELKRRLKEQEHFNGYQISVEKLTPLAFRWYVDIDDYKHDVDYNFNDDVFKVIKIVYPPDCYASPRYITTKDLASILRTSDRTANGFFEKVLEYIEI